MSGVQVITIPADSDDQRLDRFLRRVFPQLKQGQIEKMCRKGELRLDGGRVKASTRVFSGQDLRVPPIAAATEAKQPVSKISDADRQMMLDAVIYEDAHIIAINKPAGLPVQGGSKQLRHVDGLAQVFEQNGAKPKLVHRLDKDTSGLLVLARTGQAAKGLAQAFQSRETRKMYWAAVAGSPKPASGTIKFGLVKAAGHGPNQAGEKMHCVHPKDVSEIDGAKHATTDYTVVENLGGRVCWVAMVPITGRTHQLRAHIAELGNPIVGDGKYGGNAQENLGDGWGAQLGGEISRKLHLHARSLRFLHPITKKPIFLKADLPDHMQKTWAQFDWRIADVPEDPFEALI
ncbi:MAG: RluA family pseudouridine synthase [Pseudomonadota bacterium]